MTGRGKCLVPVSCYPAVDACMPGNLGEVARHAWSCLRRVSGYFTRSRSGWVVVWTLSSPQRPALVWLTWLPSR